MNPQKIEDQFQWNKLASKRKIVQFLSSAMGDFLIPVGAPLLCELAIQPYAPDAKANILRRRQAVWTLGIMGHNKEKFYKLSAEKKKKLRTQLAVASVKSGQPKRAYFARNGLGNLPIRSDGPPRPQARDPKVVPIDKVMAVCAESDDRFLRNQVALSLLFWEGPLIERTLLQLTKDDGRGVEYQITDRE